MQAQETLSERMAAGGGRRGIAPKQLRKFRPRCASVGSRGEIGDKSSGFAACFCQREFFFRSEGWDPEKPYLQASHCALSLFTRLHQHSTEFTNFAREHDFRADSPFMTGV